jgi:hypothetical protein
MFYIRVFLVIYLGWFERQNHVFVKFERLQVGFRTELLFLSGLSFALFNTIAYNSSGITVF